MDLFSPLLSNCYLHITGKIFMGLLVYVDEIILAENDLEACLDFNSYLNKSFHIKDFGCSSIAQE